ncbi:MAG: ABC transporter permease subunit [Armatimonadetes bacterium]|nr:ABC transporter permease subunit [Armatimonadota bacterium]
MIDAGLVYFILTAFTWVGWIFLMRAALFGFKLAFDNYGFDKSKAIKAMTLSGGVGAVLLLLGTVIRKDLGRPAPEGLAIPVVWLYTPLAGWILIIGAFMAISRLIQWRTALTPEEGQNRFKGMLVFAVISGLGFWWLNTMQGQISVIRGAVPVPWQGLVAFMVLALVALAVMVRAEKATRSRGVAKTVINQLVLLAGAIVFGIPFAWMLITSFKEERDLANTDGIVWVPQVQLTHPYNDPERLQFDATYSGQPVKAIIEEKLAGGKVLMEVERPYNLRGRRFEANEGELKESPRMQQVWSGKYQTRDVTGFTAKDLPDGSREIEILTPADMKGQRFTESPENLEPVREPGLRWENYTDAIEWMPAETNNGLRYLINTLWLVVTSVVGTVLSCSLVAYGFSRLRFPGRDALFSVMLATMMLPGAVTMMPQFLIFRGLGWIDTLLPLWVPTFFGGAFNVFLLKQFFSTVPMELEEAARIDGCGYFRTFWQVMLPMVKPALAVISIWTFMGAWNNFMGPLIYVSTPSKMPLAYALNLFASDRGGDQALMMAFATMTTIPVLLLFFFAQKYFIEGVQLSGLGGR